MSTPDFIPTLVTARADRARQCVWTGRGPVLLENRDLLTTAFLGTDEGMDPASADAVPLDPLGSKSFDGTRNVWVMTESGTAVVASVPGGTASQVSPLLIAQQLTAAGLATAANQVGAGALATAAAIATGSVGGAAGGTPFLHGQGIAYNNAAYVLAAGATQTITVTLKRPGYRISFQPGCNAASTNPTFKMQVQWWDATNSIFLDEQVYVFPGEQNTNLIIGGSGPTVGPTLRIVLTNNDTVNPISFGSNPGITVAEVSHHIARHDFRYTYTQSGIVIPTWFTPTGAAAELGKLVDGSFTINAGTSSLYLLPFYAGQAFITAQGNGAVNSNLFVTIQSLSGNGVPGAGWIFYDNPVAAGFSLVSEAITMPRTPCQLKLSNTGTAPATLSLAINVMEFVS